MWVRGGGEGWGGEGEAERGCEDGMSVRGQSNEAPMYSAYLTVDLGGRLVPLGGRPLTIP